MSRNFKTVSVTLTEQAQIDRKCHPSASQGSMKAFMYHYSSLNKYSYADTQTCNERSTIDVFCIVIQETHSENWPEKKSHHF